MLKDLRLAVRSMVRRPAFAAVVVLTLALGIGATTAVFSVVDGVLLSPLPYREPERLVAVSARNTVRNLMNQPVSFLNYLDWRDQGAVFEQLAAIRAESLNLAGPGEPERVDGVKITVNILRTLGVSAEHGRDFLPEEGQAEKASVALISHGLWQRRFGGDLSVIGRSLTLDGAQHTVVGILPRRLKYPGLPLPQTGADIWIPYVISPNQNQRGFANLRLVGRLKADVSLSKAQAEVDIIARRLEQQYPRDNTNVGIGVAPLHEQIVGNVRLALRILMGSVALVLLIACVNVANLMLARVAGLQGEAAIRTMLGATRWRLARQMLTECGLLSLIGGSVGIGLAYSLVSGVRALNVASLPRLEEISMNPKALVFSLGASLFAALLCGALPSLYLSAASPSGGLREAHKGSVNGGRHRTWLRGLVVVEMALALVLLVGAGLLLRSFEREGGGLRQRAGLLLRSFERVTRVDPGFTAKNVLTLSVPLPQINYKDQESQLRFYETALPRLAALPGVESVAGVSRIPLVGLATVIFSIEGQPVPPGNKPTADYRTVSPTYFKTLGIGMRQGREFDARDARDASDAVIINEALAGRFFPNENPIGRRLQVGNEETRFREIVGVVGNAHLTSLAAPVDPAVYVPMTQNTWPNALRLSFIAIRTTLDPRSLLGAIRKEVQSMDPALPVTQVRTLDDIIDGSLAPQRFSLTLLMAFAFVAGALAIIGIYGVMSYNVTQQTHDLGIRIALGAGRGEILRMVMGDGARLALWGAGLGVAGSLMLTQLMSGMLFGVSATDPLTFAATTFVLVLVCVAASGIPARRAAGVNAVVALRGE